MPTLEEEVVAAKTLVGLTVWEPMDRPAEHLLCVFAQSGMFNMLHHPIITVAWVKRWHPPFFRLEICSSRGDYFLPTFISSS